MKVDLCQRLPDAMSVNPLVWDFSLFLQSYGLITIYCLIDVSDVVVGPHT